MQIDVAVNAPEAGTIKKFLANEEDTVTVGQELLVIELGGAPEKDGSKEEASSEPKEAASKEQPTSSDPEPSKKEESKPASAPPPEKKPEPKKESPPPKQTEPKSTSTPALGNREERRVSWIPRGQEVDAKYFHRSR